jgi:hypothetical protein
VFVRNSPVGDLYRIPSTVAPPSADPPARGHPRMGLGAGWSQHRPQSLER